MQEIKLNIESESYIDCQQRRHQLRQYYEQHCGQPLPKELVLCIKPDIAGALAGDKHTYVLVAKFDEQNEQAASAADWLKTNLLPIDEKRQKKESWLEPGDIITVPNGGGFVEARGNQIFPCSYDYCTKAKSSPDLLQQNVTVLKVLYVQESVMIVSTLELGNVLVHKRRVTIQKYANHIDR